jgi:hypothetical protein
MLVLRVRTGKNRRLTLAKLAILGVSVALTLGACVADDPSTSPKLLTDDITSMNVVNEIEIPTMTPDNVDPHVVVITGLDYPGHTPLQPNIDLRNADTLTLDPNAKTVCAQVQGLPTSDVCSSLCDPDAFVARVFDSGSTGCTTQTCQLPDGTRADVDVCN